MRRNIVFVILLVVFASVIVSAKEKNKVQGDDSSGADRSRAQCSLLVRPQLLPNRPIGSVFACSLVVKGVPSPGMFGYQIVIQFDPSILRFVKAIEGSFLNQGGNTTIFFYTSGPNYPSVNIRYPRYSRYEDEVALYIGGNIITGTPVTGSGCLATVQFCVKGMGSTKVEVDTLFYPPPYTDPVSFWQDNSGFLHYFRPMIYAVYNP